MSVRVLAQKAFRFKNPARDIMDLLKQAPKPSEVSSLEKQGRKRSIYGLHGGDIYFSCTPNQPCIGPDWIKEDPLFDMVLKLGEMEVLKDLPGEPVPDEHALTEAVHHE